MSEQDDASVDKFLDGLDDRRDEVAEEDERRRSRRTMPRWEYMMWTTTETKAGRSVRLTNGERPAEYPLEYLALADAGAQGWELVAVVAAGTKNEHILYFKRPKAEA